MAAILALKREKRSLVQATPALERLVETIGEPTPQSQELREETEARVTASAAAVPALLAVAAAAAANELGYVPAELGVAEKLAELGVAVM